ncbi:MAG: ArsR/SmtB family transcription factor [Myxococcota bacterium]
MAIKHPTAEQLELPSILSALGDSTRLAMIGRLADVAELSCGQFSELGSKTVLSYHMAKLREAGLIQVRAQSTRRFVSLRRAELDERFPGLLATIVPAAKAVETPRKVSEAPITPLARTDSYDWIVD